MFQTRLLTKVAALRVDRQVAPANDGGRGILMIQTTYYVQFQVLSMLVVLQVAVNGGENCKRTDLVGIDVSCTGGKL